MSRDDLIARWREALDRRGPCVACASPRVWHNGIRWRTASLRVEDRTEFFSEVPVRRLRCGDCRHRFSRAPEGVVTPGHYQPCVVAEAVVRDVIDEKATTTRVAQDHGCHRRTIGRWVARVATAADPAQLAQRLLVESAVPVIPAAPPAVRRRPSASFGAVGVRAVWILALLEALATLQGLAPPGLAHLQHFVPAVASPSVRPPLADSGCERPTPPRR